MTKFPFGLVTLALLHLLIVAVPVSEVMAEEVLYEQRIRAQPLPIFVPTSFDGKVLPLVLDTGCYFHAIDTSMSSHFGGDLGLAVVTASQAGSVEVRRYDSPVMKIWTWKLPQWTMIGMDCRPFQKAVGTEMNGFLGLGALRQTAIDFNFDREKLRIVRSSLGLRAPGAALLLPTWEKQAGMKSIPLEPSDIVSLQVKISIDGLPMTALIDTGSCAGVGLSSKTFARLVAQGAIMREPDSTDSMAQTAAGAFARRTGRFTRGNLFGVELKGMQVDDEQKGESLGLEFLINLNFVCDLAGQRFYFTRRHAEPPVIPSAMLGAGFIYPEGQCRVVRLSKGRGPAQDAGIQKDDTIVKLGPLGGRDLNSAAVYDLCETRAEQIIDVEFTRPGEKQTFKRRLKLTEKRFVYPAQP